MRRTPDCPAARAQLAAAQKGQLHLFHLVTRTVPLLHRVSAWIAADTAYDAVAIWEAADIGPHEGVAVFEYRSDRPGLLLLEDETYCVGFYSDPQSCLPSSSRRSHQVG
jgi:hypothetical protein